MSADEEKGNGADGLGVELSFLAVEVGGSRALGGDVRLDLAPRTTVLVGRNGAGKSLLLESLLGAILRAIGLHRRAEILPTRFGCDIGLHLSREEAATAKLRYECVWGPREPEGTADGGRAGSDLVDADPQVDEKCWLVSKENERKLLWHLDDGDLTYNTGEHAEIAPGRTLLNWTLSRRGRGVFQVPRTATPLRDFFLAVGRILAGVPRGDGEREELALPYPAGLFRRTNTGDGWRIRKLAYTLANWHETDRSTFDELVEVGRRTGLLDEIKIKLYRDPEAGNGAQRRDLVSVLVDGTDIGLLSDGTLRVTEILAELLSPRSTLVLIEEPETAVHPGLLEKLLAEIDAYSGDRQIVLSTQSPQVVTWAKPHALRLVERSDGKTRVRSLGEGEITRLSSYLHDDGTLGEYVYSGALDG